MGLRDNLRSSLERLGDKWVAEQRGVTPNQLWGAGLDDWFRGDTAAGIRVTAEAAMRAAQGACIGLIADDIASLPVDFYEEVGDRKVPMAEEPAWYDKPGARRWDTWPDHITQVVISLLSDGNAFVQGSPTILDPTLLDVLDPAHVTIRKDEGVVRYALPGGARPLDDTEVMHIPWRRMPGQLRGMNPVETAKETTGLELAAREWASRFFSNGATLGGIIQVPPGVQMTREGVAALREQFANQHVGKRKAFAFGVLTGGAQWVQNTVTPQDSALAPLWRQVLEEAARIYHVPPHLLASQESGAASYASVEHRSIEYVQHAIVPIVRRLETAYGRLVPGEETYLKFNVNALLRGDIKTRAEAYSFFLQSKVLTPAYVAALEDFPPEQAAPGWLETPNNTPSAARSIEPVQEEVDLRGLTVNVNQPEVADALHEMREAAVEHRRLAAIAEERAERAELRLAELMAREQPAPVVNVAAPVVNVAPEVRAPDVRVVAEAPVVNVTTPDRIAVDIVSQPPMPPLRLTKNSQNQTVGIEEG